MGNYGRGIITHKRGIRKDEIGQLQNQFVELTQSLETEKQKQNRIIASISHDVKTPLTVIMGYAERILKKDLPREKEKQYLQTIYSKSQSINEIVNEFDEYLSYNLESALSLKEYDISYICNIIKAEYTDELSDIGVALTIINNCSNMKLSLDLLKFKRVIGNLVGNSVKHINNNTSIPTISLVVNPKEKAVLFTFRDNGCGILDSELPFIFEPLYTSDKSRKVAGLGLSICKNIVTAHGGTITATNGETAGLQIDILLPCPYLPLQ
jgi:signal transduction histidine kinase